MTLIEVVAGLAILGTLLASLVVARSRYLMQWALAGRKEQAVVAADRLLSSWWAAPDKWPRHGEGDLPQTKMRWRTSILDNPVAKDLDAQVVRLEIFESADSSLEEQRPLSQVDVVLNLPPKPKGGSS